jgi:hypothetical protein
MSQTGRGNVKIVLRRDWQALRLNAFPETEKELLEYHTYFKLGTVFEHFGKSKPDDKAPMYGWMYRDESGTWQYAHMFSPTLDSWRSWPEMFEEVWT